MRTSHTLTRQSSPQLAIHSIEKHLFFIIYVFIELKLYIQIIQTFYIQIPFLCRVTAGTRHMKGSTVDMQNRNAVPPSTRMRKFYDVYHENAQFKRFSFFLKTNFWFSKTTVGGFKPPKPPPGYAPGVIGILHRV